MEKSRIRLGSIPDNITSHKWRKCSAERPDTATAQHECPLSISSKRRISVLLADELVAVEFAASRKNLSGRQLMHQPTRRMILLLSATLLIVAGMMNFSSVSAQGEPDATITTPGLRF